jgi:hypothetical protein
MIEVLYEKMMIADSCRLGKRVYKKLFHKNASLNATDKKALKDDVDTIVWQYTFKPTTIPIQPYDDDYREYHEVALLQVNLKQTNRVNRLAEIVHRAIPYPLLVVFVSDTTCLISLAHKRFSQAEKDVIIAEDFLATCWLDLTNQTNSQSLFLQSLNIATWPHTNFYAFYRAAMDRVLALACARHTGYYSLELPDGLSADDRVSYLKQVEQFQLEKSELTGKLKKEKNLGTQVRLNIQIKNIIISIKAMKAKL